MQTFTITEAHAAIVNALNTRYGNPENVPGPTLAEWLEQIPEWQTDAVIAWIATGCYSVGGDGLPDLSGFDEAYAGEWDSFRDFAEELADDTGMLAEIPEWARPYFDMDKFAHDLTFDHSTERSPSGGVFVFRSI